MSRYTSRDGLMTSGDPEAVALWDRIGAQMDAAAKNWTEKLRSAGVKLAHPDDGWVNRERNEFTLSWYPQFDDRPEVGELIAFGRPPEGDHYRARTYNVEPGQPESAYEGYRICRVTKVERRDSILGYLQEDFWYEDTGVRVPPRAKRRRRWSR